jgi:predicted lipoprotein
MKTLPRLRFLVFTILLTGLFVAGLHSADTARSKERSFTKSAMLQDLSEQVIVPSYSNFAARCRELNTVAGALTETPDTATLHQVQAAWSNAMLAWRPAQVVRSGPLLDQDVLSRIHFWPIRRQSVEKVLRDTRPISESYIAELGAPAVGLCALEFLLFDLKSGDTVVLANFNGPQAERREVYLRALTADLARQAESVVTAWTKPAGYQEKFVEAGQESVNLVVNDLLQAVEVATEERLKYALDLHENKLLKPEFIQGAAAGISQQSVSEVIRGAQRLYLGDGGFGLASQLRQLQSPVAARIEAQFRVALKSLDALGAPLEKALLTDRAAVNRAYDECKKLEVMLKVEMASAFGVTLTFNSTDGD